MTTFAVKLGENLGVRHAELLRQADYDVERVYDEGLSGQSDEVVWQHACMEGRLFITLDLDFSDIRRFAPGTHPGLLLLRPHNDSRRAVLQVLSRVLSQEGLDSLSGCVAIADDVRTRIRRPPDSG